MHFCTAYVAIAGDKQQIVHRNFFNPVSWPEVEVLRFVHGDDSVTEVKPFVQVQQDQRAERERLILAYGADAITACLGARNSKIEMDASEAEIAFGAEWKNPLTQRPEKIAAKEIEVEPEPESKHNGKPSKAKAHADNPF